MGQEVNMTTYVYELCGPLVDDATVTRDAYRHAADMLGQIPPHLKDGYTDAQCGVDAKTYNRRTAAYRARAVDVGAGWAVEHLQKKSQEKETCDVVIFTSHRGDTFNILADQPHLRLIDHRVDARLYGMDPSDRLQRLTELSLRGPVVYVCAPWWHDYVTRHSTGGPRNVVYIPSAAALNIFEGVRPDAH
jgi:hypothetical protein